MGQDGNPSQDQSTQGTPTLDADAPVTWAGAQDRGLVAHISGLRTALELTELAYTDGSKSGASAG